MGLVLSELSLVVSGWREILTDMLNVGPVAYATCAAFVKEAQASYATGPTVLRAPR